MLQVYEALQSEGYLVNYERVPITDEKSPKERDFDLLVMSFTLSLLTFISSFLHSALFTSQSKQCVIAVKR